MLRMKLVSENEGHNQTSTITKRLQKVEGRVWQGKDPGNTAGAGSGGGQKWHWHGGPGEDIGLYRGWGCGNGKWVIRGWGEDIAYGELELRLLRQSVCHDSDRTYNRKL
ncbi:hypothetical protein Tco_0654339 [Tanacetum coccineum]|uniref:Uncharacterized protein n=1 Tax=Tanacetum coccineum TaxID=301880 RepID=A0ABQ4X3G9_9ASTR